MSPTFKAWLVGVVLTAPLLLSAGSGRAYAHGGGHGGGHSRGSFAYHGGWRSGGSGAGGFRNNSYPVHYPSVPIGVLPEDLPEARLHRYFAKMFAGLRGVHTLP